MAQENEKEVQQVKNRFHDLAERSYSQGIFTFTGFLGLSEQDLFWQEEQRLRYAGPALEGGTQDAERKLLRFGDPRELGYETPFPIVCVSIKPLQQKFADQLSHRDFLGALMNLGIDRSTLGDIRAGENEACLFCVESIAEFICENLAQVKHTRVSCRITENPEDIPTESPEKVSIQVPSLRADAVLARIFCLSREKSLELFRGGRVYVNGRLCENNSRLLQAKEAVSVRGFGKFSLQGEARETRKGKLSVEADVYR